MTERQSDSKETVRRLVLEFLEVLTEPMKKLVLFGAIPNAFTSELIEKISGSEYNVGEILETLEQNYLIQKSAENWYYYSTDVLGILREFWQNQERKDEFQKANQIALTYFDDLANRSNPPSLYFFQREALYHRLFSDESAGLEYMADLFEQACDQRQIGPAQNFSTQLNQALPYLSPTAGQYASYYEMRLDYLLNFRDNLERRLDELIAETSDPLLRARASILLGQVWLSQYEWKKAADVLMSSFETLNKLEAWRYSARAMLALGDVYVDLVENGGGMQSETMTESGGLSKYLNQLLFLPYLLLDWLRRKLWFFPGWFYFGENYQDWIMNYLLQMAGQWYHKAWLTARKVKDDTTSLNALLGQAKVAVQQRREAKARRIYSRLALQSAIQSSRYRLAQVAYGEGMLSLLANRYVQARRELQNAMSTFRSFADEANIALIAYALGKTNLLLGEDEAAAGALLESFQAYREKQDPLSQTQVVWELERLVGGKQLTDSVKQKIQEMLAVMQERQFLARFPSDLLRQFRALAYWVTLPLSYILILFISAVVSLSLFAIEFSALEISSTGKLSQFDILWLLVVGILPIFLAFWIIELVYAVVGQIWIYMAGRVKLNLFGEQPDRIILTSQGITLNRPGIDDPISLAWNEIQKMISADYKIWQRPLNLLSRQILVHDGKALVIEGITSGYTLLTNAVMKKVNGLVEKVGADIVILAHRSTYIVVLIALIHALILVSMGQIDVSVEEVNLRLSSLLVFLLVNMIVIFPPLMLWRIYLQRRLLLQQAGIRTEGYRNIFFLGATILLSVIAIVWLVISPFL